MPGPSRPEKANLGFPGDPGGARAHTPFSHQVCLPQRAVGQVGLPPILGCTALVHITTALDLTYPQRVLFW